jgi:hypothetical protein
MRRTQSRRAQKALLLLASERGEALLLLAQTRRYCCSRKQVALSTLTRNTPFLRRYHDNFAIHTAGRYSLLLVIGAEVFEFMVQTANANGLAKYLDWGRFVQVYGNLIFANCLVFGICLLTPERYIPPSALITIDVIIGKSVQERGRKEGGSGGGGGASTKRATDTGKEGRSGIAQARAKIMVGRACVHLPPRAQKERAAATHQRHL